MRAGFPLAAALVVFVAVTPASAAEAPAYAGENDDLMRLDNGVVVEGRELDTLDGYTSGFRVTAGFSPLGLPHLDLGAQLNYRESDEVPTRAADQSMILNTTSLGGSLVAGVRLGKFGLYAKSGLAGWDGDPVGQVHPMVVDTAGTTRVRGYGARLQFGHLVSRLEFEEFEAYSMSHLNMLTASLHLPF